jgi:hypothetical protein
MTFTRHLTWDGCLNVRDLGGLPAADGRVTRWGALVRSDSPAGLTPAGWAALRAHGIRTIVDLRNDDERAADPAATPGGPAGITVVHVPLDDLGDTAFWRRIWKDGLDGTPLYYRPFLERKPERCAAAVAAVADARPGGVLVHCTIGRDRAGLVALLLLALAGVAPADIADDWALSNSRLEPLRAEVGPGPAEALARRGLTARQVVVATLEAVDVEAVLRAGGLSERRLRVVRDRLLAAGPQDTGILLEDAAGPGGLAVEGARRARADRGRQDLPAAEVRGDGVADPGVAVAQVRVPEVAGGVQEDVHVPTVGGEPEVPDPVPGQPQAQGRPPSPVPPTP